jgi:dihydropyrimidinase
MVERYFDTVIRGGTLVEPGRTPMPGSLGIRAGKIAAVAAPAVPLPATRTIDATGKHVFPGVIEPHAHWGLGNGTEDFLTESRSAALGGVTTVLLFLRKNEPYDNLYGEYRQAGESRSIIDFSFHAVLMIDQHLREVDHYVRDMGITSFKFYLTYRGEDAKLMGIDGVTDGFMYDCFSEVARHPQAVVMAHCENVELVQRARARLKDAGRDDMDAWQASRPLLAEVEAVRRAMLFAEATGARLNVLHLTSRAALNEVRAFRVRYPRVFVEVCHSYMTWHGDNPLPHAAKMKPPLRTRDDNSALWEGVADGAVNTIGSDHVPRKLAAKEGSVWCPATGAPGTATLLSVLLSEGYHKRGLPLQRIAELTSLNPAMLYGLYPRKGTLNVGADADLVIVDLEAERTVHAADLLSFADYSLYEGWTLKGLPTQTLVGGRIVMEDGKVIGVPGGGRYVSR